MDFFLKKESPSSHIHQVSSLFDTLRLYKYNNMRSYYIQANMKWKYGNTNDSRII